MIPEIKKNDSVICRWPGDDDIPKCKNAFTSQQYWSGKWKETCGNQHANWLRNLRKKQKENAIMIETYPVLKIPRLFIYGIAVLFLLSLAFPLFGSTATVSWNANTESDLAGYTIYYGLNSGSYDENVWVGDVTSFKVVNLVENRKYFFVVTASDVSNNDSLFSEEVSIFVSAPEKPPTPTIEWIDTEADTMVVEIDSSVTRVAPLRMIIRTNHSSATVIDLIQIDFNDRFWGVVGTVIFTKENGLWAASNNKVSGIKSGDYYAVNTRVHALGGSWSNWGSPIPRRFKIEVLDKIISETIELTIEVQIK